ncbi:MAG: class I SAM-dependent methyltransferase [Ilumatobacter sp.]
MSLAHAARMINATGYGYISSWALLTAAEQRLFDRLPASATDLADTYPDPHLVDTWLHVLADADLVERHDGVWRLDDDMARLLVGDNSYADYLGGQILQQMTPRLTLGTTGENVLGSVLRDPDSRAGYEGWFADAEEARAYQASQYAGSLGPAKAIASSLPSSIGRVLDVGGGWGAIARAVAKRHSVEVDIVDLEAVTSAAPDAGPAVSFVPGSALDPATWPTDTDGVGYDGAILSYLFSSIPGDRHEALLAALAEREVRWIAVHDFMLDGGAHAAAWSLQHAVFVPGHVSRSIEDVTGMLDAVGFDVSTSRALVDEMTTLLVAERR